MYVLISKHKYKYIKHGWNRNNNVWIQHINFYELTSKLILNCLQKLINNLLNWKTAYPIARNKNEPMIRLPPQYFKVIPGYYLVAIKHIISHGGWQSSFQMFSCSGWHSLVFRDLDFHVPKGVTSIWRQERLGSGTTSLKLK